MSDPQELQFERPDWPAANWVQACFTTRVGGHSTGPWAGLNLANHVGDSASAVEQNRAELRRALKLTREPVWLRQTHGDVIYAAEAARSSSVIEADACVTSVTGLACAVLVADCVPILLAGVATREVAAIHAGWRGLENGIIDKTLAQMAAPNSGLVAWIGPCIGPQHYAISEHHYQRLGRSDNFAQRCFERVDNGWSLDLRAVAAFQLKRAGVASVTVSDSCVYAARERFYCYRRDGATGRMAALVWLAP